MTARSAALRRRRTTPARAAVAAGLLGVALVACGPREGLHADHVTAPAGNAAPPPATTSPARALAEFDGLPGNAGAPAVGDDAPATEAQAAGMALTLLGAGVSLGAMVAPFLLF
ncbi:MAG: hypothetical protein KIT14_04080 [bacterium]|nr:hypothetical protein [bacterium]